LSYNLYGPALKGALIASTSEVRMTTLLSES